MIFVNQDAKISKNNANRAAQQHLLQRLSHPRHQTSNQTSNRISNQFNNKTLKNDKLLEYTLVSLDPAMTLQDPFYECSEILLSRKIIHK
jgi:hypothetical protein